MAVTTASLVVRLPLCTCVYYVVAQRVTALNEVWTSVKRRGVHCFLEAKGIALPFEVVFVGTYDI